MDTKLYCSYCKKEIYKNSKNKNREYTRDHVIAKKYGGRGNTVPCCRYCNTNKGSMDVDEFLLWLQLNKIYQFYGISKEERKIHIRKIINDNNICLDIDECLIIKMLNKLNLSKTQRQNNIIEVLS